MNFHLVGKYDATSKSAIVRSMLRSLQVELEKLDVIVTSDQTSNALTMAALSALPLDTTVIVFGGDGTMLTAAKAAAPRKMLGVNQGRLGFITDIAGNFKPSELAKQLVACKFVPESRSMLQLTNQPGRGKQSLALNDVVVRTNGVLAEFDISINSEYPVFSMRADGLIISTPTGSTAYNLSAGGPIIYPAAQVICLTPINPQSLSNRPIILPDYVQVTVTVQGDADVTVDGQVVKRIKKARKAKFVVSHAHVCATFLHARSEAFMNSYFKSLRSKLNWFLPPC